MGFLANMSSIINKSAERALKIAPHLVNILQTIVGLNNSPNLTPAQWYVTRSALQGLVRKFESVGYSFISMPDLGDKNLPVANYARVVDVFKGVVNDIKSHVQQAIYIPILLRQLFPRCRVEVNSSVHERLFELLEEELSHSFAVNLNPEGVMMTQMSHIAAVMPIVNDGMLALAKMNPTRSFSNTGSLFLRDITFLSIVFAKKNWNLISARVAALGVYDIEEIQHKKPSLVTVRLHPRQSYIDEKLSVMMFGVALSDLNVYTLLRVGSFGEEKSTLDTGVVTEDEMWKTYLYMDDNFGPRSIYSKLIGSSISSLNFSLDLISLIGMRMAYSYGKMTVEDADVFFRSRFECFHFESIYDILNPHLLNCKFRNGKVTYEVYCDIYKNIMECLHVIQNGIEKLGLFHEEVTELFGYRTRSDEREATSDQMLSPYAPIGFTSPFLTRGALKIELFISA